MEDLAQHVERLELRYAARAAVFETRRAVERYELASEESRAAGGEARMARAESRLLELRHEKEALARRQAEVSRRAEQLAGRLWMIRRVSEVMLGVATWPVLSVWGLGGFFFGQLGVGVVALLVIPRRT